jgi:hypothetical protein
MCLWKSCCSKHLLLSLFLQYLLQSEVPEGFKHIGLPNRPLCLGLLDMLMQRRLREGSGSQAQAAAGCMPPLAQEVHT